MGQIILPGKPQEPEIDYNELEISSTDSDEVKRAKIEMFLGKQVCEVLAHHYPKRNWRAGVSLDNQVIVVMCTDVSTEKGYYIHLTRSLQEIRDMLPRIGGEILERAGLSREKKFNTDVVETLKRDVRDNVVNSDMVAPEEKYATKH